MPRKAKQTQPSCVTCIIPARNEEATIGDVIDVVKKVKEVCEVLVVDDGSKDGTGREARKHGARVVRHSLNLGKGAAMKTGARKAKHDYIAYIDADLKNLTAANVRRLVRPLVLDKADFVKAGYKYSQGRVTKLVAKPLLNIVYPFFDLEHPLSGEIALNRKLFDFDRIENGWGVDIQLVLQAAKRNLRTKEVIFGDKEHKHQTLDELSLTSEQVIRTVLCEMNLIASKHKIVFFDLDETLIIESNIELLAQAWGFTDELHELYRRRDEGEFLDKEITKALAKHFKGRTQADVNKVCSKLTISRFAQELISHLRHERYRVRIISLAFSPVVQYFASQFNVYDFVCPQMVRDRKGVFTGRLKPSRFEDVSGKCCGRYVCKRKAIKFILKKFGFKPEEAVSVGDGWLDECMFASTSLSFGYGTDKAAEGIETLSEISLLLKAKAKEERGEEKIFPEKIDV